jgi:SAM-dependent methyltransferase
MAIKFSHKIPKLKRVSNRSRYIEELVKDKKVLHGGCVDSGLLEERLETGLLLHSIISKEASEAIGVDVDKDGIEKMKSMGFENVVYADLETWDYDGTFDVIVMGEIIEHVDNCGKFLKTISRFCNSETLVIFTTPNAYYFLFWIYTFFGRESIHPDHNYLFSFNALRILLLKFNFEVVENAILWGSPGFYRPKDNFIVKSIKLIVTSAFYAISVIRFIWPQYGNSIIVTARLKQS